MRSTKHWPALAFLPSVWYGITPETATLCIPPLRLRFTVPCLESTGIRPWLFQNTPKLHKPPSSPHHRTRDRRPSLQSGLIICYPPHIFVLCTHVVVTGYARLWRTLNLRQSARPTLTTQACASCRILLQTPHCQVHQNREETTVLLEPQGQALSPHLNLPFYLSLRPLPQAWHSRASR